MVLGMFRSKKTSGRRAWNGSPGKRLYAIGDVHGCFSEMLDLLVAIEADHRSRPNKDCIIVFLGDLIDRGPDSSRVIEFLARGSIKFARPYFLLGNHEEMFLRILRGEANLIESWLEYGGRQCMESYGLSAEKISGQTEDAVLLMIRKRVPQSHIKLLELCVESIRFGDYLLVHAGVDPEKPIDDQDERQMRWIREPFLSYTKPLECMIVHGHTITPEVVQLPHRIGVDTGAYMNGKLSAVRIEDSELDIISVDGKPPSQH